jgi:hypothetical protein
LTILNHENHVGRANRVQAVSYDNDGSCLRDYLEALLKQLFGLGVES